MRIDRFLLVAFLAFAGCKKTVAPQEGAPDSQLAFITVSEYLNAQMTYGAAGIAYILLDTSLASFTSEGSSYIPLPFFHYGIYQSPESYTNATSTQPWIEYMHLYAGAHTMTLTDTGGHDAVINHEALNTNPAYPTTVIFADSLGTFGAWVSTDTLVTVAGQIRIRLVDLSPDAGSIFFSIGGQAPPAAAPLSMNYGKETGFINFPSTAADTTLPFLFYNAGDSTDVITVASLQASPGHSYTIIVQGYENSASFNDPVTGKNVSISPDLRTMVLQDY